MWARGVEAYLMEGKAPVEELRTAFARFRAWLTQIYKDMRNLNVELSAEIRDVMDRLVASEEEIAAAQGQLAAVPLFGDPAAVGMSEEEAASYQEAVTGVAEAAAEDMAARTMRAFKREQDEMWLAERRRIRDEVAVEVNQDAASRAYALLTRGKMPDDSDLPEGQEAFKLSWTALR